MTDWIRNGLPQKLNRDFSIRFMRLAIPLGVLLTTLYLARQPRKLYILLPILLAISLAILRYPYLAILAMIPASLMIQFQIRFGFAAGLNAAFAFSALIFVLWLIDMFVNKRQVRLTASRINLPLILFAISAIVAFLVGQLPWVAFSQGASLAAQLAGLAIFLLSATTLLIAAQTITNLRILEWMTWLFLAVGGLYVFLRLIPGTGRFIDLLIAPGASGSVFWIWLVALSFSQALFNRKLHWRWRLLFTLITLATFYISIIQNRSWASGWLPPVIAIIAILIAVDLRFGLLAAIGGVLASLPFLREVFIGVTSSTEQWSYFTRLEAWRIVWEIIRLNPVTGLGPSNYYWYTQIFPILGNYVKFNSHNQYVDMIAQVGILGLILFFWFAWEMLRLGWRLKNKAPEGFERAYAYAGLGGLVAMVASGMLGDWVIPFIYNVGTGGFRASIIGWLFLGGLVALDQIIRNREGTGENTA